MVILYNRWIYQLFDQWIITILFQKNTGKPTYQSDARNGKHKDIVWQVNLLLKMMIIVMVVMIMSLRMCCLGEVGHRQFGWLSQLLLCFRGWKVFTQFMSCQRYWTFQKSPWIPKTCFNHQCNVLIIPGWPTGLSWRQHFGRFLEMIEKWLVMDSLQYNHILWEKRS